MRTADDLILLLDKWVGIESNKAIIDNYNNNKPLPRNYKVKYTDQWCATGLSSAIYSCGLQDIVGVECGCQEFIEIFKKKGIWYEDGSRVPMRGDIILYNWDSTQQPNDGWADHIGVVTQVLNNSITVIECNYHHTVSYRTIPLGWHYIRGFARPHYLPSDIPDKTITELALEVIAGKWGLGAERKKKLLSAGYNYNQVQKCVNSILSAK